MRARVVVASVVAPLATPLLYWLGAMVVVAADPARRGSLGRGLFRSLELVFAFGAPVAYLATLAGGLPALWLVRRFGTLTLVRTALVGALVGDLTAAILHPWLTTAVVSVPLAPWQGAVLGAATAALWGRLVLR